MLGLDLVKYVIMTNLSTLDFTVSRTVCMTESGPNPICKDHVYYVMTKRMENDYLNNVDN